jgi:hypothetical protein
MEKMEPEQPMRSVSQERALFTWLVRIGVLANVLVVSLISYFYLTA